MPFTVADSIRITRTYAEGTAAGRLLKTYWSEVNATLAAMGEPEAVFEPVLAAYEDGCSVDQAAHEIADPMWGYETFKNARADARQAARSGAHTLA